MRVPLFPDVTFRFPFLVLGRFALPAFLPLGGRGRAEALSRQALHFFRGAEGISLTSFATAHTKGDGGSVSESNRPIHARQTHRI